MNFFMFDYLQQFNKLPKELREKVSSPAAMDILSSLESKYNISLAMVVMQVMIKQILIKDLVAYFVSEMGLPSDKALSLSKDLQERLFFSVSAYLGFKPAAQISPEDKELEILMKNNGVLLPSEDLMSRCRQILLTYQKGVRTRIDARAALERPVGQGGLGLDAAAADRLLHGLDHPLAAAPSLAAATPVRPVSPPVPSALDDLINKNEAGAYDLKSAIASGRVKMPEVLAEKFKQPVKKIEPEKELAAPVKNLVIEAPDSVLRLEKPDESPVIPKEPLKPIAPIAPIKPIAPIAPIAPKAPIAPITPVPPKPVAPIKAAAPVAAGISRPVVKGGMWSKLFKDKPEVKAAAVSAAAVSAQHLAEAVKTAAAQSIVSGRPAASSDVRPKLEDVRLKPKVMGPLDELRFIDLINFRRLGNTPKEITGKIIMKIRLLEKDGYDRMVAGVKAWRQSPVNRLYVRLVQEAVVKGITLREAVEAHKADNKEILTMEEIEAIVAMNSQLMF